MKVRINSLLFAALFLLITSFGASAMDVTTYRSIAKETIREALSGSVSDVDGLIAKQERLISLGIDGCKEYASKDPKHAKLMDLVVKNADNMKKMTLEEIEAAWHDGDFVRQNGIDFDAIDHFSPALSHMDAVLHPATSIIALKEYKRSGDTSYLEQVKDELSEVLEHLDHIR